MAYKPKRKFSGRTGGANIPNIHVYICDACKAWHNTTKPAQCIACGHMVFVHFPSKAEAKRWGELLLEQAHKYVSEVELQPRFPIHAVRFDPSIPGKYSSTKIGEYRGDFRYIRDGKTIIEDVKGGADTPLSCWKRKHVEAEYNVKIKIIRR